MRNIRARDGARMSSEESLKGNNSLAGCLPSVSTPPSSTQADSHGLNGKANGKTAICLREGCGNRFTKKRVAQEYCTPACRKLAWRSGAKTVENPETGGSTEKRRNGCFSPTKSKPKKRLLKMGGGPDLGTFVRDQILAQQDQPNPISFRAPDRTPGRVWLATDQAGAKIIGDGRHWRINIPAASKVDAEARAARLAASSATVSPRSSATPKGIKVRLCIGGEEKLQVLGCGWRNITCQFRGANVVLHHNGNKATIRRAVFKTLISSTRRVLERNRKAVAL
jgi:hypothetical protein